MSNYITYEERMEIENCLHNGKSFGQIAKELGKDRSTIYRYEKGDIENLPLDILEPIAKALRTTPQHLMGWEEVQKKNNVTADIVIRLRTDEDFLSLVEGLNKLSAEQLASVKPIVDVLLKG